MLGDKINELLKARGLSQTDLARKTGIAKQTINSIIKRNNKAIEFSAMEKIADALEVPIEYFSESVPNAIKIEPANTDELPQKDLDFLNILNGLNHSNRRILLGIAEVLLREQATNPDLPEIKHEK